jgi:hypothetical protein
MKYFFKKPRIYWFLGILFFYLLLSFIFSGFYDTIPLIFIYASTVNWFKLGFSLILTLIIGFFVSVNSILAYSKYKERKKCKGVGFSGIGAVGGLVVGVCPLCVTGLFPLIFGLFGLSFSFAILPFQGLEIQVFILLLMIYGFNLLKR